MDMVTFPPFISNVGVYLSDLAAALIPSSEADISIFPSLIVIYVPSIHSPALRVNFPPSIVIVVVA